MIFLGKSCNYCVNTPYRDWYAYKNENQYEKVSMLHIKVRNVDLKNFDQIGSNQHKYQSMDRALNAVNEVIYVTDLDPLMYQEYDDPAVNYLEANHYLDHHIVPLLCYLMATLRNSYLFFDIVNVVNP